MKNQLYRYNLKIMSILSQTPNNGEGATNIWKWANENWLKIYSNPTCDCVIL